MRIADSLAELVVPIDSVTPYEDNPRQGDIGAIAVSLDQFGQVKPIVVNRPTGVIVGGNHTWLAAKELGSEVIAVSWVEMTEDEARAFMLADNQIGQLGGFDESLLARQIAELQDHEDLMIATAYSPTDVAEILAKQDLDSPTSEPGVAGTTSSSMTPAERKAMYEASAIRSILIPVGVAEYDDLIKRLGELRASLDLDSNADVVIRLIVDATS